MGSNSVIITGRLTINHTMNKEQLVKAIAAETDVSGGGGDESAKCFD